MNILYANWMCLGAEDAVLALSNMGHNIYISQISDASHEKIDWDYVESLTVILKEQKTDIVFSFNFFPSLSEACHIVGCKYLSMVYDNPSVKVYTPSVTHPCNYVFTFDSAMCDELRDKGVSTINYAPLPVNTNRLNNITLSALDKQKYSCDVAFVGSLYNEEHNLYDRLQEKAGDGYLMGYLDGVIMAQMPIYGCNFLSNCLHDDIVNELYSLMPYDLVEGSLTELRDVYADYYLCRKLAFLERSNTLEILSDYFKVFHYTNDPDVTLASVLNKGKVNYFTEMPKAFKCSKINLNISLRSIKNGIPLRAMDIMGSGGFLLSNYQKDFLLHFEPDKDFVYYSSLEELVDKTDFYLKHETQRKRIARNGLLKIEQNHTYEKWFENLFKIID